MTTTKVRHHPVMVPRPRTEDGFALERSGGGMRLTRARDLSPEICAICGLGLTKHQMASGVVPAYHDSVPVVELQAADLAGVAARLRASQGSATKKSYAEPSDTVGLVILDSGTVRNGDGLDYDVLEAINTLRWVRQLCPEMGHEYAIRSSSALWAWDILAKMLSGENRDAFKGYFRGYQYPNMYWDAPDGMRYWRKRVEIDRCLPEHSDVRRVDEKSVADPDWDAAPWAPKGDTRYELDDQGGWWPTDEAIRAGYEPCKACLQTWKKGSIVQQGGQRGQ